ncbi:MAG: Rpn family recombination-promoting nuclease/putative transposase [Zoogloeaceae bacterium]|nr:Rpn family recombination-promoting nuclease/putative transposase [Zoogloeaceae bacterium]
MTAVLLLPDDDYASLALENPRLPSAMLNDKNGLLDVLAQTKSGRLIDIEIMPVAFYDPKRGSLFSGDLSLHTLELPKEHPDDETPPLSTTAHPNRS